MTDPAGPRPRTKAEPVAAKPQAAEAPEPPREATAAQHLERVEARFRERPPEPLSLAEKLRRTWARQPLVALLRHKRRVVFYQQFLSLVRAGAGMPTALSQLARWAPSPAFKRAIEDVSRAVARGESLGQALRRHASTFDDTNIELLVFAEQTGALDKVLQRIIDYMERMQKLRWSVVMSLIYPAYLVLGFTFAGPMLGLGPAISGGASTESLPFVYAIGLATNLMVLGAGVAAFLFAPLALVALGLDQGWDRLKLKLPLFGPAYRAIYGARFFTSLALGIDAGVEIVRTVTLALRATGSADLTAAGEKAVTRIRGGATIAEAFEDLPVLDPMSLGAIAIAEKTGTLDETLVKLADDATETAVRRSRALALAGVVLVTGAAFLLIVSKILGAILGPISNYYKALGDI